MGQVIWGLAFALAVCATIAGLVAIDRAFFGEDKDSDDAPAGSSEPSSGKYSKDDVPFD